MSAADWLLDGAGRPRTGLLQEQKITGIYCCLLHVPYCKSKQQPKRSQARDSFLSSQARITLAEWNEALSSVCLFSVPPAAISNSRGEFLLNGEFVVSMFKREIKVGNAVIEYSGSDHVIERINCTDRIEEEIVIQVSWASKASFSTFQCFISCRACNALQI